MAPLIEMPKPAAALPDFAPLDERVWQAWLAKGRERERRGKAAHIRALQWISVAALMAGAAMWLEIGRAGVVIKFIVTAGALVSMAQALHARSYSLAVVFAMLMALYNPWVPLVLFSGNWPTTVLLLSAIPFLLPLANPRGAGAAR